MGERPSPRRALLVRVALLVLVAGCTSEPPASSSTAAAGQAALPETVEGRALARLVPDGIFRAWSAGGRPLDSPRDCAACHPKHVAEWRAGPHAFAASDGVFDAMHRAGQTESGGALEGFCFDCHAPAASAARTAITRRRCLEFTGGCESLEAETDATRPAELGPESGVTCSVCHEIATLHELENAEFDLAYGRLALDDDVAHRQNFQGWLAWSSFEPEVQDALRAACETHPECALSADGEPTGAAAETLRRSALCGTCHQVTSPRGVAVEETYTEWLEGGFVATGQSCVDCHMPSEPGPVATRDGNPDRARHRHGFTGVDIPLDASELDAALGVRDPERYIEAERARVQALLDDAATLDAKVSRAGDGGIALSATIANQTGHHLPSGATQERELWLRVRVWAGDSAEPYWTRGDVSTATALPDGLCERWDEADLRCLERRPYDPGLRIYRSVFFRLAEHEAERRVVLDALRKPRAEGSLDDEEAEAALAGVMHAAGVHGSTPMGVASNAHQAFWDHFALGRCTLSFSSIYYRQPESGEPNYAFKSRRVAGLYQAGQLDRPLLEALRELTFTQTMSGSRTLFVDTALAAARPELDLRWNVLPPRRRALGHDLQSVRAPLPTPELMIPVDFPWDADGNMACTIAPGESAREQIVIPPPPVAGAPVRVEVALLFRAFPPDFLHELEIEARPPIFELARTTLELP